MDTRKTTPNFRLPEKWAVLIGGGFEPSLSLCMTWWCWKTIISDVAEGLNQQWKKKFLLLRSIHQSLKNWSRDPLSLYWSATSLQMPMLMLSCSTTWALKKWREAVKLVTGCCKLEASGGITETTIASVAETGVDYISVGALTHCSITGFEFENYPLIFYEAAIFPTASINLSKSLCCGIKHGSHTHGIYVFPFNRNGMDLDNRSSTWMKCRPHLIPSILNVPGHNCIPVLARYEVYHADFWLPPRTNIFQGNASALVSLGANGVVKVNGLTNRLLRCKWARAQCFKLADVWALGFVCPERLAKMCSLRMCSNPVPNGAQSHLCKLVPK